MQHALSLSHARTLTRAFLFYLNTPSQPSWGLRGLSSFFPPLPSPFAHLEQPTLSSVRPSSCGVQEERQTSCLLSRVRLSFAVSVILPLCA
jgi:hypothetical protein